jgi:signal peptidase II
MVRVPFDRYVIFALIAFVGCAADLATKAWMFSRFPRGWIYWLWEGHAGIQTTLNTGALFGIGQGLVWLFAWMSVFAAVALPLWLFWFRAAHDRWLTVALGCVMAGVLGNLYDRLLLAGVRDWILLQWNDKWQWPNFNLTDSMLVVGACLLVWHARNNPATSKHQGQSIKSSASV